MKTAGALDRLRHYQRQHLDAGIILHLLGVVQLSIDGRQQGQPENGRQSRHSWHPLRWENQSGRGGKMPWVTKRQADRLGVFWAGGERGWLASLWKK